MITPTKKETGVVMSSYDNHSIKEFIKNPPWELKNMEKALSSPISMGLLNTKEDFERLSAVRWILRSRREWAKKKFSKVS